jgi:demethylmenaquinone methyltransferase/2-methoxy-6-polyprenyl-1,4-benzoquinol methylase
MAKENIGRQNGETAGYFDQIADIWDSLQNIPALTEAIRRGLMRFRIAPDERVLDIGCGTGNSTSVLLSLLSDKARIDAVDISAAMIARAKAKVNDPRVFWHIPSVNNLPIEDNAADRALCYSVWPHIRDAATAIRELHRVLRPQGTIHIWHTISRAAVNAIHEKLPGPVRHDRLLPAMDVAELLTANGFEITETIDNDEQYLVCGVK